MEVKATALLGAVKKQEGEILRALETEGFQLGKGQSLQFVSGQDGGEVAVKVVLVEEGKAKVLQLPARDLFTKANFKAVTGLNPIVQTALERVHVIINGHKMTVEQLLRDPAFTADVLRRSGWKLSHIVVLRQFLQHYGLTLRD